MPADPEDDVLPRRDAGPRVLDLAVGQPAEHDGVLGVGVDVVVGAVLVPAAGCPHRRVGPVVAGEDLFVNLARANEIRRVLVFACIYDGVPSFDQANAVVTFSPAAGPPIEVRLDEAGGKSRMCAIALLEGNGTDLTVRREVRYVDGARRGLDQAYGWGMNWSAGRK